MTLWRLAVACALAPLAALKLEDSSGAFSKVLSLLEDMRQKMTKEEEHDQEVHDKQACWCNKNTFDKTSAVNTNKRRVDALSNGVKRLSGDSQRWAVEKEQLTKEIASAEAAKKSAQAEDLQQVAKFNAEEARLLGLEAEIVAAHEQIASPALAELRQKVLEAGHHAQGSSSFLQRKPEGVAAVLDGLKTDVAASLKTLRSQETQRSTSFNRMLQEKAAEVKAMEERKAAKTEAIADAAEKISSNKEVISNLEVQVEEDSKFLMEVESKCQQMDKDWNVRQETRQEEFKALDKTKRILKDSSFTLIQAGQGGQGGQGLTSFLQESSVSQRKMLAEVLLKAGRNDLRLVTLAMRVKIDSFEDVKAAILNMTASLQKEDADEVRQRSYCMEEFEQNEKSTEEKKEKISQQSTEVAELEAEIQAATNQASGLQAEIALMEEEMKLASQNREKENAEFQAAIMEQREMKQSLRQAAAVLQDLYNQASFIQVPEGLARYETSGGGVLAMLQELIKDAEAMVSDLMQAEATSQSSFEAFASETQKAVAAKTLGISKQEKKHGMKAVLLAETSEAKHLTASEMKQLSTVKEQLHESCDFLLSQFDVRKKARAEEIEALNAAAKTLSGA